MVSDCEKQFTELSDSELAVVAATDRKALGELIVRYNSLIKIKSRTMCNDFVDADDLSQEGVMGLLDAVKAYRTDKDTEFSTFANVCIKNRMINVLAKAGFHVSLEDTDSFTGPEGFAESPESIVVRNEHTKNVFSRVSMQLSDSEWNVLQLYLRGFSYNHIAAELRTTVKVVDNAMQRVRRKLKLVLRTENNS